MSGQEKFLSVKNMEVVYTSAGDIVHAVNGVSFDLAKGETLGLVGETGAGKTTIARAILRILPNPPAIFKGGEIWLDGQNLMELSEEQMLEIRGNRIAMIFQDPMTALNPLMTVGDQILEVLLLHNSYGREQGRKRVVEILEMVGIPGERYVEYPHQFSGGMKQRVVIAMALACDPELLLADEPTTALDVTIQAQVLSLLLSLKEEMGLAILFISHDMRVVYQMSDRVIIMKDGRFVESGDVDSVYFSPQHPYTKELLLAAGIRKEDEK